MSDPTREQAIEACKLAQRYREHRTMQPKMNEAYVPAGEQVKRFIVAEKLLDLAVRACSVFRSLGVEAKKP